MSCQTCNTLYCRRVSEEARQWRKKTTSGVLVNTVLHAGMSICAPAAVPEVDGDRDAARACRDVNFVAGNGAVLGKSDAHTAVDSCRALLEAGRRCPGTSMRARRWVCIREDVDVDANVNAKWKRCHSRRRWCWCWRSPVDFDRAPGHGVVVAVVDRANEEGVGTRCQFTERVFLL